MMRKSFDTIYKSKIPTHHEQKIKAFEINEKQFYSL